MRTAEKSVGGRRNTVGGGARECACRRGVLGSRVDGRGHPGKGE
jgi:hypothetical protein